MEAIKPGSTLDQWVRPKSPEPLLPPNTSSSTPSPQPPPIPPRAPITYQDPSPYAPANLLFPGGQPGAKVTSQQQHIHPSLSPSSSPKREPEVMKPPKLETQSSECTYIPANEINVPPLVETAEKGKKTAMEMRERSKSEVSSYSIAYRKQAIKKEEDKERGETLEESIVRELSEQLDPVQIDLLIQMFRTRLSPDFQQQQPGSSEAEVMTPERRSIFKVLKPEDSFSHVIGYAKEGKTDPYRCLANIILKMNKAQEEERAEGETSQDEDSKEEDKGGVYLSLVKLLNNEGQEEATPESSHSKDVKEADPSSSLIPRSSFTRKNAVRSVKKNRPRSTSEGSGQIHSVALQLVPLRKDASDKEREATITDCKKPVSTLCK